MSSKLATLDPEFKVDVMSLLLTDNIFCKTVIMEIPEDMFSIDPDTHLVFLGLREFFQEHDTRPRPHELEAVLVKNMLRAKMDEERQAGVISCLDNLLDNDDFTPGHVKAEIYDAIKLHKMAQALDMAPDLLDEGKFDEFVQIVNKAAHSVDEDDGIIEYWEDTVDRVERRKKALRSTIPTGHPGLDKLMNGGFHRGKVGIIMAPSGVGKSFLLSNFCTTASRAGYKSAYCTYELDADDTMERMDAQLANIMLREIRLKKSTLISTLIDLRRDETPAPLFVHYRPTKSETLSSVTAYLERLRSESGVTPDIMFLDYFDLLAFEGAFSKKYEALEENMEKLRGLAGEYNMAIWTASQTNRGAMSKDQIDMDDMASSFGKAFPSDLIITLSQNKKEKTHGAYRLFIAKSRLSESGNYTFIRPAFDTMSYEPLPRAEASRLGLIQKKEESSVLDW